MKTRSLLKHCPRPHVNTRCRRTFRFFTACVILFGILVSSNLRHFKGRSHMVCSEDFRNGKMFCRPACAKGYFSLPGMTRCHPWLKCDAIKTEVTSLNSSLGNGGMKTISKAYWKNHTVVLNECSGRYIKNKYPTILEHMRDLQPSDNVVQLIGYCGFTYVTEFHPFGSADNYEELFKSPLMQKHDNIRTRLGTCVSYIEAVHFMHNSPIGTRVLQDTQHLHKCVSQFLVTSDLQVVVNDLDFLPEADRAAGLTAKDRGGRDTENQFIAPERISHTNFDEKADIWIIPSVCEFFLGPGKEILRPQLSEINLRCKRQDQSQRPTAEEVLDVYKRVLEKMGMK